ncbi:MAG: hypothetical protein EA345_07155 [Halomonas sp.]|nr:hypothetical protein [Halomonas sp.]TVP49259.1 MAG: hypothetical protein EA345_07155 [Halomonas sp.]
MDIKSFNVNNPANVLITIPSENKRAIMYVNLDSLDIFNDKCKHRGGPIHLCYKDAENVDRCPWHDHKIKNRKKIDYITAVYIPSTGKLKIINNQDSDAPWPIKIIYNNLIEIRSLL